MKNPVSAWRWALIPVGAFSGFIVALALAIPLNRAIHAYLWNTGHAMPGKEFLDIVMPFDGALAAALVILAGAFTASACRVYAALVLLLFGALLAWCWVGEFYPSSLPIHKSPVRLWWPFTGTCLGGCGAFAIVCLVSSGQSLSNVSHA